MIELKEWTVKRKWNLFCFSLLFFAVGIENILNITTLWDYIKSLIRPRHPYLWYSTIAASYFLAEIPASILFGSIVDRYRNIRMVILVSVNFVVIGNLVYALPFHPVLALVGRLLAGLGCGWRTCVVGEVARLYPKDGRRKALFTMFGLLTFAKILGPGMNYFFMKVDFTISYLHVTYANVPGIYGAALFLLVEIICFIGVSDLPSCEEMTNDDLQATSHQTFTNIYNPQSAEEEKAGQNVPGNGVDEQRLSISVDDPLIKKEELPKSNDRLPLDEKENARFLNDDDSESSTWTVFIKILMNTDGILIMVAAMFFGFRHYSVNMWIPVIIREALHWGIGIVYAAFLIAGVVAVLLFFVLAKVELSKSTSYNIHLISYPMLLVPFAGVLILPLYHPTTIFSAVLLFTTKVIFAITSCMSTFLAVFLTDLLPHSVQATGQSVRITFDRVGSLFGFFVAGILYPWLHVFMPIMMFVALLLFAGFVVRRRSIMNPTKLLL